MIHPNANIRRSRLTAVSAGLLLAMIVASCAHRLPESELVQAASANGDAGGSVSTETTAGASLGERTADSSSGDLQDATDEFAVPSTGQDDSPVAASDGGESTSGGGNVSEPEATSPAATGSCTGDEAPIAIGTVGQQTGVFGAFIGAGPKAVQAWVGATNAAGGLHCHQVRYIVADDGGDPSRHQALVQQLVEEEGVIAFVHMNAPLTGQASVDYLNARRIPVIGNEGGQQWFYESPMHFPQASTADALTIATIASIGAFGADNGTTKLASISCIEAPACANIHAYMPRYASRFGLDLRYRTQASLVQPDYTSACQSSREKGADVLFIGLDGNSISRVARSCQGVGFRPQLFATSSTVIPSLLDDSRLDGLAFTMQVLPWTETGNPQIAEFVDALARYAPGVEPDSASVVGWVSAKLFEVAAANLEAVPTSEAVLDGLWAIKNNDLGGLTYPLTFTRDAVTPATSCFWLAQIRDGGFISPNGGKRTCV